MAFRRAVEAMLGIPFTEGNRITPLRNGREIFPAMLEAIERARRTIRFLTFVYWTGDIAQKFAEALSRKALQGVDVRVMLDAYGAMQMNEELVQRMRDAGVTVVKFRPLTWRLWRVDNRTHRKVLVCDGEVAFTGGVGIAQEWEGDARNEHEWRDTHFRIEGPAVRGVQAAFLGNWAEMDRLIRVPDEPTPRLGPVGDAAVCALRSTASPGWSDIATLFQVLAQLARWRLRIATAYFVPDHHSLSLLQAARERGVQVELMLPGPHIDSRLVRHARHLDYEPLLRAGISLFHYQPSMLHTKIITIDDFAACVGSANFNHRSLRKDDEFVLLVVDPALVGVLNRHFDEDLERCRELRLDTLKHRGAFTRALDRLACAFIREI